MAKLGKTTIACRNCQAVTVIDNEDLETMTEFRCAGCGVPMTEPRFAVMMIGYYTRKALKLSAPPFGGMGPEMFKVSIDFDPHCE